MAQRQRRDSRDALTIMDILALGLSLSKPIAPARSGRAAVRLVPVLGVLTPYVTHHEFLEILYGFQFCGSRFNKQNCFQLTAQTRRDHRLEPILAFFFNFNCIFVIVMFPFFNPGLLPI
jgi:hypothetical protein